MRFYQGRELSLASLLGLVALASLLSFVLLAAYGLQRYFAQERAEEVGRLSAHAESLGRAVDRELRSYIEVAEVLARSRHLRTGDISAFENLARDAAGMPDGWPGGYFALLDRSGQHLLNTRVAPGAPLPKTLNPEANRRVLETRQAAVGDLEMSPTEREILFVARVPVIVDGEARYVLAFAPDQSHIDDVLQDTDRPVQWLASIVDGQGRIVARSDVRRELFGANSHLDALRRAANLHGSGLFEGESRDGVPIVIAFRRSTLSAWYIFVWVPKEVLEAKERAAFWLALGFLAVTLLFSVAMASAVGFGIREPARRMLSAARALGQGKPVSFKRTQMREANVIGGALVEAARLIAMREARLREREKHTRLLLRELSHRSKNLLAVIEAMARQAGRAPGDRAAFLERFGARIASLARSHDLLVEKNWQGVRLTDLIRAQLAPFVNAVEQRITMDGPDLSLRPEAAQNLGMALHELGTNASKYGALSVVDGHVRIDWEENRDAAGKACFRLRWQESGGPPVAPPSGRGFGRTILEHIVPSALGGRAHLEWKAEGLVWNLDVPAEAAVMAVSPS